MLVSVASLVAMTVEEAEGSIEMVTRVVDTSDDSWAEDNDIILFETVRVCSHLVLERVRAIPSDVDDFSGHGGVLGGVLFYEVRTSTFEVADNEEFFVIAEEGLHGGQSVLFVSFEDLNVCAGELLVPDELFGDVWAVSEAADEVYAIVVEVSVADEEVLAALDEELEDFEHHGALFDCFTVAVENEREPFVDPKDVGYHISALQFEE